MSIELGPFFLPERSQDRLPYLTRFVTEPGLSPFTEEQANVIALSQKTANATKQWLKMGIWGITVLSMAPALVTGLPPVVRWLQEDPLENTFYLSLGLTSIAGAVNLLNFLATGTIPDRSATDNTNREYQIEEIKGNYEDLSCRLIELTRENPELAARIAKHLDVSSIQEAMGKSVATKTAAVFCNYLRHAQHYVLTNTLALDAPWPLRTTVRSFHGKFALAEDPMVGSPNGVTSEKAPLLTHLQANQETLAVV